MEYIEISVYTITVLKGGREVLLPLSESSVDDISPKINQDVKREFEIVP